MFNEEAWNVFCKKQPMWAVQAKKYATEELEWLHSNPMEQTEKRFERFHEVMEQNGIFRRTGTLEEDLRMLLSV